MANDGSLGVAHSYSGYLQHIVFRLLAGYADGKTAEKCYLPFNRCC